MVKPPTFVSYLTARFLNAFFVRDFVRALVHVLLGTYFYSRAFVCIFRVLFRLGFCPRLLTVLVALVYCDRLLIRFLCTAYRCHHRVLERTYVIKRLHSQFAEDARVAADDGEHG